MPLEDIIFAASPNRYAHIHSADDVCSLLAQHQFHDATSFVVGVHSANDFLTVHQLKHGVAGIDMLVQVPHKVWRHASSFDDGDNSKQMDTQEKQLEEVAKDEDAEDHMTLEEARIPDKEKMGQLGSDCKLELDKHEEDAASVPASLIGHEIAKGAKCVETTGSVLLKDFFGVGLNDADTKPGTKYVQAEAGIKIGEMQHANLEAVKDSCHDFAELTLNRFGDRSQAAGNPVFKEKGDPQAVLTPRNASQELRAFGRCLDSLGMASAWQGCEFGELQRHGGDMAEKCEEIEGEAKYHWAGCNQQ